MFILVLILAAVDFWVVKNISGRLLVGLRWKSEIDEKGKEVWKFESYNHQQYAPNRVDKAFFWGSQILGTVIWGFFFIINVIGLNFFNVTIFSIKVHFTVHLYIIVFYELIRLLQVSRRSSQKNQRFENEIRSQRAHGRSWKVHVIH
jgi:hypothetical protein